MRPTGPIRVLIIDAAPVFARTLAVELNRCAGLHTRASGGFLEELRGHLLQFHPEVILLDLGLRQPDALDLLHRLRGHYPVPIIVLAVDTTAGRDAAALALQRGALEAVRRPDSLRPEVLLPHVHELAAKIRVAAAMARPVPMPPAGQAGQFSFRASGTQPQQALIAIGASTGGTQAIEALLAAMPDDCPPIVIVQHMPAGFTRAFANRLNQRVPVCVREAVDGEVPGVGEALLARGDTHLVVRPAAAGWRVQYTHQEPVNRHCPSVDVLFGSVAQVARARAVGVLLTGMGADGARGLLAMRAAGAATIAQSAETCVVYGMPKVAVDLGAALHSAAPQDVPALVLRILQEREHTPRVAGALRER